MLQSAKICCMMNMYITKTALFCALFCEKRSTHMRNFKRFLALALAMLMLTGMAILPTGAAEEEADYTDAARRLAAINILKGDEKGNLMLDSNVTRWHTALFFVQAITGVTDGPTWNETKESEIFTDVPEYGTAIDYAAGIGLIRGRGNGIYGYSDNITYQDMLVMAVRALGYETDKMTYPYGYIIAAEKLNLNENVAADVHYTDALTRGETAQIIWNMLNAPKAFIDPINGEVVYPGEFSAAGTLLGADARTTLLQEAKFAQDKVEATVIAYTEAKLASQTTTVTLQIGAKTLTLKAEDLGITEKTRKATYLGLPITLYLNMKYDDFVKEYSITKENDAKIVFADVAEFTTVVNLGDDGKIKYTAPSGTTKESITLDGSTYSVDNYNFDVRMLTMSGWEKVDATTYLANFLYSTKNGYTGANSYGDIQYAVLPDGDDADELPELLMLYSPYSFGRYRTRTLRYQPTVSDESFVTIGTYARNETMVDKSDNTTHFIERMLGEDFVNTGLQVKSTVTSVSKKDGQASKDVILTGAKIKNHEFMFYSYNPLDNILHVASAEGAVQYGRLTAYSKSKETVKINGTTYDYGFAGSHTVGNYPAFNQRYGSTGAVINNVLDTALGYLTVGENNVNFVTAGGKIVYLSEQNPSPDAKVHSFAVVSVDAERVAELLDMTPSQYAEATRATEGLYIDSNGNVAVASLNLSKGTWELAGVKTVEFEDVKYKADGSVNTSTSLLYDIEEDAFPFTVELGKDLQNYSIFGAAYTGDKKDALLTAINLLKTEGLFMVRANKSKVYSLATVTAVAECLDYGTVTNGLVFSDQAAKTNHIKAVQDENTDAARVTMKSSSVVVAINELGEVGVRKGVQVYASSLDATQIATVFGKDATTGDPLTYKADGTNDGISAKTTTTYDARFYSAKAALIVMKFEGPVTFVESTAGSTPVAVTVDVEAWSQADAYSVDETYYITTQNCAVEYEIQDDATYNVTVSGLYDLRKMKFTDAVTFNVKTANEAASWADGLAPASVLHMTEKGKLVNSDDGTTPITLAAALEAVAEMHVAGTKDDYKPITLSKFTDAYTVEVAELGLDGVQAISEVKLNMVTLNMTAFTADKYDFNRMVLDVPYTDALGDKYDISYYKNNDGTRYCEYTLDALDETVVLDAPVAGQLNQYILDMAAAGTILIPDVEEDYLANAAEAKLSFTAVGMFEEDTGVLTVYMVKILDEAN